eukprot:1082740-Prorocentrum_lima.AAC.1
MGASGRLACRRSSQMQLFLPGWPIRSNCRGSLSTSGLAASRSVTGAAPPHVCYLMALTPRCACAFVGGIRLMTKLTSPIWMNAS